MGEGLVLSRGRIRWIGGGQICPFEICSSKVGDAAADRGRELCDRFLDLGGIIVAFCLVDAGDPAATSDNSDKTKL